MIKWLFFDIDNTLYDSRKVAEKCRKNAIKAMVGAGLTAEETEAYDKLKKIVSKQGSNYEEHFDELVKFYNKEKVRRIIAAGIVAYHNTKREKLVPYENVKETLVKLKKTYKLGIISNGLGVKQWEKLIRLGIDQYFEIAIISEEVGVEKPDIKIFQTAIRKTGCSAEECVMIGDKETDMAGKNAGMKTVSVNPKIVGDYNINKFEEIITVVKNYE